LLKAKKKGFKPKITELKGRKEDYQEEKSKTEKDLGENKVRMKELEKALDDIDNTWKTFDPSVQLTQFEMHCE
jgi:predicted  nucleic acid-binding Zn-ribbon protein